MFDYDNRAHNAYGFLIASIVSILVIVQFPTVSPSWLEVDDNLARSVLAFHFVCIATVALEATIFRAEYPFFSQFVVASGLVATLLQATVVSQAPGGSSFDFTLALLVLQCLANGFMFSKIINEI